MLESVEEQKTSYEISNRVAGSRGDGIIGNLMVLVNCENVYWLPRPTQNKLLFIRNATFFSVSIHSN